MLPSTILFCCVANSARSQMAEALAREMAPSGWAIFSAGSAPAAVHSVALQVLAEVGIDGGGLHSKGFAAVPLDLVDVVITLCADEVCPQTDGRARRLHWPLPDPAATRGDPSAQLASFRQVRDELRTRLERFFAGEGAAL